MVIRLAMRKVRGQQFDIGDYLTIGAIACLAARASSTTIIVLWGNNNLTAAYRASNQFNATDIYHRKIGSKVTLCDRVFHSTYHSRTREANRTTWGTVEMFAAAVVANVPTLFALRPRHPTHHSTTIAHSPHYADTAGFRQVKDYGIEFANNIELRHVHVEDVDKGEEFGNY
ncbi:hypothetical protein V490_00304 [Pseudogymnoascus sp. VKM F-3557]|nr:hypothetical protein V490_00304 [Pseudogymnoascus sp. VKM F-3557]